MFRLIFRGGGGVLIFGMLIGLHIYGPYIRQRAYILGCVGGGGVRINGILQYIGRPRLRHIQTNFIHLQTLDLEICSILTFHKGAWEQLLYCILCMIFQEQYSPVYILLTDQISFSSCLDFFGYCATCLLFAVQPVMP